MPTNCTIALSKETRQKLENLKMHERETFDGLINRLIEEINHFKKQITKKRGNNKKLEV